MKRLYFFISLFLFSTSVFAQTPTIQIQMSEELKSQNTNQVNLEINLIQSLDIGFSVELPVQTMAAITEVKIGNENVWLKKEDSIPQNPNTLHWTEQDGQIMLLFAPNALNAGQNIQLSLQVFQQANLSESRELRINQIEALDGNTYRAVNEMNRVQIFQTNTIETR